VALRVTGTAPRGGPWNLLHGRPSQVLLAAAQASSGSDGLGKSGCCPFLAMVRAAVVQRARATRMAVAGRFIGGQPGGRSSTWCRSAPPVAMNARDPSPGAAITTGKCGPPLFESATSKGFLLLEQRFSTMCAGVVFDRSDLDTLQLQ